MAGRCDERLFSYGSLRQPEVQLGNFGRLLNGEADAASGWRVEDVHIADPAVVALSGSSRHKIMVASGDPGDCVEGMVFVLTPDELAAADAYETADYARVEIALRSGGRCWAYISAAGAPLSPPPPE